MAVKVDKEKCTGCGNCVETCPTEALSMKGEKVAVDADTCIDCGVCIEECPVQALSLG